MSDVAITSDAVLKYLLYVYRDRNLTYNEKVRAFKDATRNMQDYIISNESFAGLNPVYHGRKLGEIIDIYIQVNDMWFDIFEHEEEDAVYEITYWYRTQPGESSKDDVEYDTVPMLFKSLDSCKHYIENGLKNPDGYYPIEFLGKIEISKKYVNRLGADIIQSIDVMYNSDMEPLFIRRRGLILQYEKEKETKNLYSLHHIDYFENVMDAIEETQTRSRALQQVVNFEHAKFDDYVFFKRLDGWEVIK